MADFPKRLRALNDFAFMKILGEKGDELQLTAFLNATLKRTGKNRIVSVDIVENKELPAEITGGKVIRADKRIVECLIKAGFSAVFAGFSGKPFVMPVAYYAMN
jgi:hypothetical protein